MVAYAAPARVAGASLGTHGAGAVSETMTGLDETDRAPPADLDLAALYRQYAPLVLRRVRRFVGPQEAEEVVHEIFLRALEKRDTFRSESSPVTWLYTLTTRHCLNRIRNSGRRRELLDVHAGAIPAQAPMGASAEARLFLQQFWKTLDDEVALIGIYYFVDGLTHAEIAKLVGCSPRTVGYRIQQLQAQAQAAGGSESRPDPRA